MIHGFSSQLLGFWAWGIGERQCTKMKVHEGAKDFTSHWLGSRERKKRVLAFIAKLYSKKPLSYYFINGLIFHEFGALMIH